jgi:hypothetical protein
VLRGNLAPAGAIIKPAAASPQLMQHHGRALVFHSIEDFHACIDDPGLDADANTVLVLPGCGQRVPAGCRVSITPLPKKLLAQGVRDMVRICDGRMSGTPTERLCCMSPPRPRPADNWHWCRRETSVLEIPGDSSKPRSRLGFRSRKSLGRATSQWLQRTRSWL